MKSKITITLAILALAAPALFALNPGIEPSAMYVGEFAGAASGGAIIAAGGYGGLSWVASGWMLAALATSVWVARRMRRGEHA